MKKKAADILAITPHPIDIEMGMGGTVARWTREGKNVVYVICTTGDKASSDPNMMPEELAVIRKKEQLSSAKMLGVGEVIFLGYPDLGLSYTPEFRKDIIRLILEYRPEIVATCDPYERYLYNPDHHVTGQVVMNAVWPCAQAPNTYRDLLRQGYQLHKVQEILLYATAEPNYVNNISDTFDIKMAALSCHKSQVGDPPETEFIELVTNMNTKAAQGQNFKFGEAFHRHKVVQRL
jgi:LmbE family N-acetylglucosaminyl deacetylase